MELRQRLLTAALVAPALLGLLVPSVVAEQNGKDARTKRGGIEVPREAFNGLMSGAVIDWYDGFTQVRFNLEPDAKQSADLDVATGEWELIFYAERCGERTTFPLLREFFVNTNTYGPRVLVYPNSPRSLVSKIGSIELIHDGPSPHHHVDELGPGRHHMGCVNAEDYRVR